MSERDTTEFRRLREEIRDNSNRNRYLNELYAKGEISSNRLDDEQIVLKILQMRRGTFNQKFLLDERVEEFARATGNTYEGARIMIAADERYGTLTFVRGSTASETKADPIILKKLREAGHSPKPEFIKISSGFDGMFKPTSADFNHSEVGPLIRYAIEEDLIEIDREGYMVDIRQSLPSGSANIGFGKRYVSDVDLALVFSRNGSGTSKCNSSTYSEILRSNSWFFNQKCSCTHGAFLHWATKKPPNVAKKVELTNKHLNNKSYGHRGLSASQIGRSEFLRPPKRVDPEKFKNAKFELLKGDPLIGFFDGKIIRTTVDRVILDIVSLRR